MKNRSLFYSVLIAILALSLTSCAKKYGCFYSLDIEAKVHQNDCPTTECLIN